MAVGGPVAATATESLADGVVAAVEDSQGGREAWREESKSRVRRREAAAPGVRGAVHFDSKSKRPPIGVPPLAWPDTCTSPCSHPSKSVVRARPAAPIVAVAVIVSAAPVAAAAVVSAAAIGAAAAGVAATSAVAASAAVAVAVVVAAAAAVVVVVPVAAAVALAVTLTPPPRPVVLSSSPPTDICSHVVGKNPRPGEKEGTSF